MNHFKKLGLLLLCAVGFASTVPVSAESEEATSYAMTDEDASALQTLYESYLLPTMFYGESIWDASMAEADPAEAGGDMLSLFESLGVDVSAATAEELAEFIDYGYEVGFSNSIFDLAAYYLEVDPYYYRDIVSNLLNYQLSAYAGENEEYQMALDGRLAEAAMTFKDDWYGDTTDDERIALADAILALLQSGELDTGDYTGNTLAQSINDLYDQDNGNSMLFLAISVCGLDEEIAIDLTEYLTSVVDDYYYDAE